MVKSTVLRQSGRFLLVAGLILITVASSFFKIPSQNVVLGAWLPLLFGFLLLLPFFKAPTGFAPPRLTLTGARSFLHGFVALFMTLGLLAYFVAPHVATILWLKPFQAPVLAAVQHPAFAAALLLGVLLFVGSLFWKSVMNAGVFVSRGAQNVFLVFVLSTMLILWLVVLEWQFGFVQTALTRVGL